MSRALAGQTVSYTSSMLMTRGVAVAWLIFLPSFLSAAEYGVFGLVATAAALVNLIVPLEVTQGLARYYATAGKSDARKYSGSAWTFTLVMLGMMAVTLLMFSEPLCQSLLGDNRYLPVFRLAIAFFVLNTMLYFVQNQFRWEFRSREFLICSALFAFTTLVLSMAGAFLLDPLTGILIGQIAGVAIAVGYAIAKLRHSLALGLRTKHLQRMLSFSLPLVLGSLALYLSTYVARFFLQHSAGLSEVGRFIWASQVASLPALLLLGVQASLTPFIMKNFGQDETRWVVARLFEAVISVELILCLTLGLFTPDLIEWAGYDEYVRTAPLVLFLAPAHLLLQLYVFLPGFAVAKRTDLQLTVSLIGAVAAIIANYILVPRLADLGAAIATLGSNLIFFGCWYALSNRLYPIPIRWRRVAALSAIFVVFSAMGGRDTLSSGIADFLMRLGMIAAFTIMVISMRLLHLRRVLCLMRGQSSVSGLDNL